MRYLIFVLITSVTFMIVGCKNNQDSALTHKTSSKTHESNILDNVSYPIIGSEILPGIKRSLDVRLNKKVSEETLRNIALELKSQDKQTYRKTFICYYLPGMTVDAGAWATTHFTPDLEVKVLGLTADEEKKLTTEFQPSNRDIIGRWIDDSSYDLGGRVTIFRDNGKLFIEKIYKDGSGSAKELVESKSPLGRRFSEVKASPAGDHWVISSDGNLQLRDNDGLISTLRKID